jgi:hypothetical protein
MLAREHTLFTEKFRPTNPTDYIGNDDFKQDLNQWIEKQDLPHLLLLGGAGGGKTTAAKLITSNIDCDFLYINCSDENGIETIRDKVKSFASAATFRALKVIIMDECLEENTLVTVLRGGKVQYIPIKDLDDNNDLVKSYNEDSHRIEWKPFRLWDKGEQETLEIEFENGEVVICTPDHKWYVENEEGDLKIVKASELEDYMGVFNPKG